MCDTEGVTRAVRENCSRHAFHITHSLGFTIVSIPFLIRKINVPDSSLVWVTWKMGVSIVPLNNYVCEIKGTHKFSTSPSLSKIHEKNFRHFLYGANPIILFFFDDFDHASFYNIHILLSI